MSSLQITYLSYIFSSLILVSVAVSPSSVAVWRLACCHRNPTCPPCPASWLLGADSVWTSGSLRAYCLRLQSPAFIDVDFSAFVLFSFTHVCRSMHTPTDTDTPTHAALNYKKKEKLNVCIKCLKLCGCGRGLVSRFALREDLRLYLQYPVGILYSNTNTHCWLIS